jgi:hypothetical protein
MAFARWFVLFTGIVWASYGVACAFFPEIIGTLTGIGIDNWPADIEVRAWYLATEIGLGILAFCGWKEPERYLRINLLIWLVVFTTLVGFRFVGTWVHGGTFALQFGSQYLPYSYHIGTAYLYELPSMLIFAYLRLNDGSGA